MPRMSRSLRVEVVPALPRLAWVAAIPHAGGEVRALAGSAVERSEAWLVEGVWDGTFEAGRFDRSAAFFGTGLRIDGERTTLCASTAPVDRILSAVLADRTLASNSLPLLLAVLDARLDPDHDHWSEMRASIAGIGSPTAPLAVRHASVRSLLQLYHGNLVLAGGSSAFELRGEKPSFATFGDYRDALRAALAAIGSNLASPARRMPLRPLAVCSAGYDSPAVACLGRAIGVREAFATAPGAGADAALEDGAEVARALGLEPRPLRDPRSATSELELEFVAATVWGEELTLHELARELRARTEGSVVLSGHFGGVVWEGRPGRPEPSDEVRRGADDGLGLAEVRLASGFVHAPVPFLFARAARDLRRISLSSEMAPWRLGNDYDRPIPRRILEEAGVPRALFGQRKRAIWEAVYEVPFDPELRARFSAWLDFRMPGAERRLRIFGALTALDRAIFRRLWRLSPRHPIRVPFRIQRLPLRGWSSRQLMFKWANDELAERRRSELGESRRFLGL